MTRELKVWGTSVGTDRRVVAAASKRAAAHAVGMSEHMFHLYASETGNPLDREVALANPGVGMKAQIDSRGDIGEWEPIVHTYEPIQRRKRPAAAPAACDPEHDRRKVALDVLWDHGFTFHPNRERLATDVLERLAAVIAESDV